MMPMELSGIAILNIKGAISLIQYRCIIRGISTGEAINLIENKDLTEESATL